MDWMTPLGYLIGLSAIGYVLVSGQTVGLIFNLHAFVLVFGGTLGSTLLSYPTGVIRQALQALRVFFLPGTRPGVTNVIDLLTRLAEKARRIGPESLEDDIAQVPVPFLARALRLMLDGLPTDLL